MLIALGVQRDPRLELLVALTLAEQRVAGVDHQVDQHLFKLIDMPAHLHRKTAFADPQFHPFTAHSFGQ
ncbi:hypothetical protein D3C73_1458310 [compost metagenome]